MEAFEEARLLSKSRVWMAPAASSPYEATRSLKACVDARLVSTMNILRKDIACFLRYVGLSALWNNGKEGIEMQEVTFVEQGNPETYAVFMHWRCDKCDATVNDVRESSNHGDSP